MTKKISNPVVDQDANESPQNLFFEMLQGLTTGNSNTIELNLMLENGIVYAVDAAMQNFIPVTTVPPTKEETEATKKQAVVDMIEEMFKYPEVSQTVVEQLRQELEAGADAQNVFDKLCAFIADPEAEPDNAEDVISENKVLNAELQE